MKYSNLVKAKMATAEFPPSGGIDWDGKAIEVKIEDEVGGGDDEDLVSSDPLITLLQTALSGEYQQWDLYTSYASRLKGYSRDGIAKEFKDHAEEELGHIDLLQRHIVSRGYEPTVQRKSIPDLPKSATIGDIVALQLDFEKEAVALYTSFLSMIKDGDVKTQALKLDVETILTKEQEHVHDLELLIEAPTPIEARVLAQIFRPMEPGEATKPQAGYGCGCRCGEDCTCNKDTLLDKIQQKWCTRSLKELTPDLYAKWTQGHLLSAQEKELFAKALSRKWGLLDLRSMLRFLDQPKMESGCSCNCGK